MKRKHSFLAIAALLATGGLWLGHSAWRAQHLANHKSSMGKTPQGQALAPSSMLDDSRPVRGPEAGPENYRSPGPTPGPILRPPNPHRQVKDFAPGQRGQVRRDGDGPGG